MELVHRQELDTEEGAKRSHAPLQNELKCLTSTFAVLCPFLKLSVWLFSTQGLFISVSVLYLCPDNAWGMCTQYTRVLSVTGKVHHTRSLLIKQDLTSLLGNQPMNRSMLRHINNTCFCRAIATERRSQILRRTLIFAILIAIPLHMCMHTG